MTGPDQDETAIVGDTGHLATIAGLPAVDQVGFPDHWP